LTPHFLPAVSLELRQASFQGVGQHKSTRIASAGAVLEVLKDADSLE